MLNFLDQGSIISWVFSHVITSFPGYYENKPGNILILLGMFIAYFILSLNVWYNVIILTLNIKQLVCSQYFDTESSAPGDKLMRIISFL